MRDHIAEALIVGCLSTLAALAAVALGSMASALVRAVLERL